MQSPLLYALQLDSLPSGHGPARPGPADLISFFAQGGVYHDFVRLARRDHDVRSAGARRGTDSLIAARRVPGTVPAAARVTAVLFDLDNTLVDLLRVKRFASMSCAHAMIAAGADLGMEPDAAGELLFLHYLDRGIESDDAFETFLRRNLRNKMALRENAMDRVLAAGVNAYLKTKDTLLTPYPGVTAGLVALTRRGYRLGVVTDAPRLKAWQRLWAVSLAEFFEVVITRHDTGQGKPSEAPFRAALDAFGLPPHEVAMVGDWPERDVAGANRLGLFTVLARYGRHGHEDVTPPPTPSVGEPADLVPDAAVESFTELLSVFPGRIAVQA